MTDEEIIESKRPMLISLLEEEARVEPLPGSTTLTCESCRRTVRVSQSGQGAVLAMEAIVICSEDAMRIMRMDPSRAEIESDNLTVAQRLELHEAGLSDEQIELAFELARAKFDPRWPNHDERS